MLQLLCLYASPYFHSATLSVRDFGCVKCHIFPSYSLMWTINIKLQVRKIFIVPSHFQTLMSLVTNIRTNFRSHSDQLIFSIIRCSSTSSALYFNNRPTQNNYQTKMCVGLVNGYLDRFTWQKISSPRINASKTSISPYETTSVHAAGNDTIIH